MRSSLNGVLAAAFVLATGCSSVAAGPSDAGGDAGMPLDAGNADAGSPVDAGVDAGPVADAGSDAGNPIDGGHDAGLDAGPDLDGGPDAGPGECPDGGDLVYLIDDSNQLFSFDPRSIGTATEPFQLMGTLACPASAVPVNGWTARVTPYALSVDRTGAAWVLYASGEIFKVGVHSLDCSATAFVPSQPNWLLFKLAFIGSASGADRLMVSGGDVAQAPGGNLGEIDLSTLNIQTIGRLPSMGEYGPELTGAGLELWGFSPGVASAFLRQIDTATAAFIGSPDNIAGGFGSGLDGWAFARWDTSFYLFISVQDSGGQTVSSVQAIDRQTGALTVRIADSGHLFIAAGVSTCAP